MAIIQLLAAGRAPASPFVVDVLVVAGGGAGGKAANYVTGGGGAGGRLTGSTTLTYGTTYVVTVGAGGSYSSSSNGSDSTFGSLTAVGGGRGATGGAYPSYGANGGSGGGSTALATYGGSGTSGQGNSGDYGSSSLPHSICTTTPSHWICSGTYDGGGGGAGGNGSTWYAGSGVSAGDYYPTALTVSKGGRANDSWGTSDSGWTPVSGTANTGNGGDGCKVPTSSDGGSGGSGLVVIRTALTLDLATASTASSVVESGSYRYYVFTGSGSFTP